MGGRRLFKLLVRGSMKRSPNLLAVMAVAAAAVMLPTPAVAVGQATASCTVQHSFAGRSSKSDGASTWSSHATVCGKVSARVRYENYPGSALYWSAWSTATSSVSRAPQGNVIGGGHKVSAPAFGFSGTFNT